VDRRPCHSASHPSTPYPDPARIEFLTTIMISGMWRALSRNDDDRFVDTCSRMVYVTLPSFAAFNLVVACCFFRYIRNKWMAAVASLLFLPWLFGCFALFGVALALGESRAPCHCLRARFVERVVSCTPAVLS
jgi:hypothetical protein